jgi:hypothetical protein
MKDLNQTLLLMELVVDKNRTVDSLRTHDLLRMVFPMREPAEQIDVIKQGPTKREAALSSSMAMYPTISARSLSALCLKRRW